jgi:hypothetical protein
MKAARYRQNNEKQDGSLSASSKHLQIHALFRFVQRTRLLLIIPSQVNQFRGGDDISQSPFHRKQCAKR